MNVNKQIDVYREQLKNYFLFLNPKCVPAELNELVNEFQLMSYPKHHILLKAGENSDMVYFICKGLVRIYYIKENKEITNWFIKENMMSTPIYSILTGENNFNNYETIEDTIALKINYSLVNSYFLKYHSLERFGRKNIERYYTTFMKKTYDLLYLSAEERYHLFIKENNDLLNRVPLKYIASFLGITQETLSRMRAKQ